MLEPEDAGPAVVVVDAGEHDRAPHASEEHLRVHELEHAHLLSEIERRGQEAHSGVTARLDAVDARLGELSARLDDMIDRPLEAPAETPEAAEDIVAVPAAAIEPAPEEVPEEPARRGRTRRRHRR